MMRVSAVVCVVAFTAVAAPASAQSTASFPAEPGASSAPSAPPAPGPAYSATAQPGWGGAAMAAPAPVAGVSWTSGEGSWEPAARPAPTLAPPPGGDPALDGYHVEEHTPATPIVVGSLLLAIPYATGLGIAAAEGFANGSGWLAVPALGPWLALAGRDNPCDSAKEAQEFNSDVGNCVAEPFVRGMLVLDGVLQATGAVVLIVGASGSEKRVVPNHASAPRIVAKPGPVGRSGYGLGVHGSF